MRAATSWPWRGARMPGGERPPPHPDGSARPDSRRALTAPPPSPAPPNPQWRVAPSGDASGRTRMWRQERACGRVLRDQRPSELRRRQGPMRLARLATAFTVAAALLTAPLVALAQPPPGKVHRIGWLHPL